MRYPRSRTAVPRLICLLVVLSTVGCLGGTGVLPGEAKERALAAEEEHITERFENAPCVESWGLTSSVGQEKEATVTKWTTEGVFVEVTHPFWYSTKDVEADVESNGRYLVTPDDVQRISGTNVSPC